jgi:predicted nucleotidyltransferase component of viral defense system
MELKDLRKISLNSGLSINYIIKDKEISKIFSILENKIPSIILKGGTGINRVYFENTKRFSEDLDFDIYSHKSITELKIDLFKILKKELSNYIVDKPRIMNLTIRYDVKYINKINKKDKIRLEFRYNKSTFPKSVTKKIVNFGFVPYKSSLYYVYDIYELIFQKLAALIGRDDGKDIYDLNNLLCIQFNKKELNKLVSKYNKKTSLNLRTQSITKLKLLLKNKNKVNYFTNHFIQKQKRNNFENLTRDLIIKLEKVLK